MASRFWVLGTGTWDASDTTHWAATSGGAGGQSVPGSGDTVTFDANSGGGTVTLNFGGTITVQSITMGAFTGTWDNSVNNNNITLSLSGNAWNQSGSGTRTIKLGTATYTLTGAAANWVATTSTNLTYTGNTGANIVFTGTSGDRSFAGGTLSHGNVTFGGSTSTGAYTVSGSCTMNSLVITAPNAVYLTNGITLTITAAFTWTGSSSNQALLACSTIGGTANVAAAGGSTATYFGFRDVTFTGSPTASNSFNFGNANGITITGPSAGANAARVIGG